MQEHDNDKLEGFFRKVAGIPDIAFNEADWKKLEARLDAKGTHLSIAKRRRNKIVGAAVLAVLFVSSVYWLNRNFEQQPDAAQKNKGGEILNKNAEVADAPLLNSKSEVTAPENNNDAILQKTVPSPKEHVPAEVPEIISQEKHIQQPIPVHEGSTTYQLHPEDYKAGQPLISDDANEAQHAYTENSNIVEISVDQLDNNKALSETIQTSAAIADKIKQKASVELPGPEEWSEEVIVTEEYASDQAKQLTSPRLSLLLSLAPDFSSISINQYSDPGEAFGVMLHYHVKSAWSFSAGIVRSHKKYSANGEDYSPPKGYWKRYTNGVIPQSVDGSCNILEIPVMVQYTVAQVGRNKFLVGGGVSSYIMLDESYHYNFEQPNPGSKEGWDSENNSSFLFNMINFTIGYERQLLPGLMIGIEPYIKVPMQGIGWSDLKLFSTGASLTLRYTLLKKEYPSLSTRSRSPD